MIPRPLFGYTPDILHQVPGAVVVVLTSTRIIKSVVTGQAPVTLGWRNTPGKEHKQPKVVNAYITADAITVYWHRYILSTYFKYV